MKKEIKERVLKEAILLKEKKLTIRQLANIIGVSKSTVHNDMRNRLKLIDKELYLDINELFLEHIKIRHYLGGISTQKKYKKNTIK